MLRPLLLLSIVASLLPSGVRAADTEQPVTGGRWYSQTGTPGVLGFALVDDQSARFWSEFQRHGGVDTLGYPVSRRFRMDGFVVQATQRVLMQWRPESGTVAFVNVFDRLHDLGHDEWLLRARQTPHHAVPPEPLSALEGWPAIRAKYQSVRDPLAFNGLPTSQVQDVGNHYALRAQRVVFQLWKEKVPWAEAGEVTVALGGDIAKSMGVVPPAAALVVPPGPDAAILDEGTPVAAGGGASPAEQLGAGSGRPAGPGTPEPADLLPRVAEAGPGAKLLDDSPVDAAVLAAGRTNPGEYVNRLHAAGYVRGHRRGFLRDAAVEPSPTKRYVIAAEVDLFTTPDTARAYWARDAGSGWASREPEARIEPLEAPIVGEESAAFRVVSGDVAARGVVLVFRRGNGVASVSVVSQVSLPTLEEVLTLARAMDDRLRRAMQP